MDDGCICMYGRHVLSSLNKLDAGDPEEILLSSRDGKDLLVVTFADVRRWAPQALTVESGWPYPVVCLPQVSGEVVRRPNPTSRFVIQLDQQPECRQ